VQDHGYNFAEWILKVGKRSLIEEQNLHEDWIELPLECIVPGKELVNHIFCDKLYPNNFWNYNDKAILAPTNQQTFSIGKWNHFKYFTG